MTAGTFWWWELSTADFESLDMERIVAIQPVAAVEQHGPHLPVAVDAAINAGIVRRAVELLDPDAPVLVLPALNIGKSNEHIAFPGTLTIDWQALGKVWYSVGESVRRTGCRKIIFFNSHGGQTQLVDITCRDLRVELGMFAVACSWFQAIDLSDLFDRTELAHGIHAGMIETSVMRHLDPARVRMDRAEDFRPASIDIEAAYDMLRSEGKVGFGWQAQDLHPSGACGNASAATAELGREIVDRAARALVALAMDVARYPLSGLRARPAPPRAGG